eukprot:TRINITY_DN5721_c0_g1_i2.p2 TRINITY_DN5721_c0_g1~~TRINITY_DN5721_c0_g1_i2.p2  ORF type:complete len:518 (+),score=118.38 TRINITY_DN5721_c0_g1_i2:1937-3490(+)
MCSTSTDVLTLLFLLKLVGMVQVSKGKITSCPFDITGLFETVDDMKAAPKIITSLFELTIFREYILEHREGKFTVMLGYSDSVRDGSALASDSQVNFAAFTLRNLQEELNKAYKPEKSFEFILYRGRGDTIPRGFGGSIDGAILSQAYTAPCEDHTEQNRYLRRYFSNSSATDHYHRVYSAHLHAQTIPPHPMNERYQKYFNFFGVISNLKWDSLVKSGPNGGKGELFFRVLEKYSILPHLAKSHFASRPIARSGSYNIDTIRAIPFTMVLAQLRDFSSAFYGTGTAFEVGCNYLSAVEETTKKLVTIVSTSFPEDRVKILTSGTAPLGILLNTLQLSYEKILSEKLEKDEYLSRVLHKLVNIENGVNCLSWILNDLVEKKTDPLSVLRELYKEFRPFAYSIENKETALLIRHKEVIDMYLEKATDEEKSIFEDTEEEAALSKKWVLAILQQEELVNKHWKKNMRSPELFLLHRIQSHYLKIYNQTSGSASSKQLDSLDTHIQMTILSISEGLGFGG